MFGNQYTTSENNETIFSVDPRPIKFGVGASEELAYEADRLQIRSLAVFADKITIALPATVKALQSLDDAWIDYEIYDKVRVEPTDKSFMDAADFLSSGDYDGIVSIGGGSVIDTAKAANLLHCYPAEFLDYVNTPVGRGVKVPGKMIPHIACPTTAGTGSESTGVAVFDLLEEKVKTGISSPYLKPDLALIDPSFTWEIPKFIAAATGFDVLTHAIESYTAIPFTQRTASEPAKRSPYQGANPHSDSGSLEAIKIAAKYLVRAVNGSADHEARTAMMYAATLAGNAFGNAGVHVPHAMSYSVAGMIKDYQPEGWPEDHSLCPHGISVVVNAPAAFKFTGEANPERHWQAAEALGADMQDVESKDGGEALANRMIELMRECDIPNGLSALGYTDKDISGLVSGAYKQKRLLVNSPRKAEKSDLEAIYREAMSYW